jgi:hypothetical protein
MSHSTTTGRPPGTFFFAVFQGVTIGLTLLVGCGVLLESLGWQVPLEHTPKLGAVLLVLGAVVAGAGLVLHRRRQAAHTPQKQNQKQSVWDGAVLLGMGIAIALPGLTILLLP